VGPGAAGMGTRAVGGLGQVRDVDRMDVPSLEPFKDDVMQVGETLVAIATETEQTAEGSGASGRCWTALGGTTASTWCGSWRTLG
jgi:hypothetical protein